MPIIGSASVEIRAIDNLFERDVRDAVAKLKDVSIKIAADVDLSGVRAKIDTLRKEVQDVPLQIKVTADTSEAIAKLEELHTLGGSIDVSTNVDTSQVDKALAGLGSQTGRDQTSHITAIADTGMANAELNHAARDRTSKFKIDIPDDVMKGLKGAFYTLTGALPVDAIVSSISEVAANFESLAYKAAMMATKVGSAGAELLTFGADALTLAGDLTDLVGVFAMGPAVITSFVSIIATTKMDWANFGKSMSDNAKTAAKAMAQLPPEAQAASKEIKILKKEMGNEVQGAFWKEMGTSLQDLSKVIIPAVTNGLKGTSVVLADLTKGILGTFADSVTNGGMKTFFDNMNLGLSKATPGVTAVATALNTLSAVGSKQLPALGDYITKMGEKFNTWIQGAAKTGQIDVWIHNAVTTVKELGHVVGSTIDIFKGLTKASDASGGKGLATLAETLKKVSDTVNKEPFQSKLVAVLKDARDGAEKLGEGFHKLFDQAGNASVGIGNFLKTAGGIGGALLKDIAGAFNDTHFAAGFVSFLDGIKYQADNLGPAFKGIGDILGNLGDIAGAFFKADTGGINHLVTTISTVIGNLKDGIVAAMPIFNTYMQNLLQVISGPVETIAKIIGNVLQIFAGLPGPVQEVIMAFATFFLLKGKFDAFSESVSKGFEKVKKAFEVPDALQAPLGTALGKVQTNIDDMTTKATKAPSAFKTMASQVNTHFDSVRDGVKNLGSSISDGVSKTVAQIKPGLTDFATTFAAGIKNGIKEGLSSLTDMKYDFTQIKQDFTYLKDLAKYNFQLAGQSIKDALTNASQVGSKALAEVKTALSDLGGAARAYVSGAKDLGREVMGFIDDHTIYMQKRFADLGDGIKTAASGVATTSRNIIRDVADGARATLSEVSNAALFAQQTVQPTLDRIGNATKPVIDRIGSVATATGAAIVSGVESVKSTVATIVDHTNAATAKLGQNFAPAKAAFSQLSSDISYFMTASKMSIDGFTTASGARISTFAEESVAKIKSFGSGLGSAMKTGLSSAASGLLGVLGGPWGIALTAAITLMSAFGDAQAKQKQKVDDLASSLDQQTGAITDVTKKAIATQWMDSGRDAMDDFWRGVNNNGKNSQEVADALKLDPKIVTDSISNAGTRQAFSDAWKSIGEASKGETDVWGVKIIAADFSHLSDEQLKTAGTTREALGAMSGPELQNFAKKVQDTATATDEAQKRVMDLSKALGTNDAASAILAKNYDILANKTSTASDKFSALKQNMDILNGGTREAADAQKNYHQAIDDTYKSLENNIKTNGIALNTLVDTKGAFDMTSQAGRDLSTTLQTSADSVTKLGSDALDKALKSGKSLGDAQNAAILAMQPGVNTLRDTLANIGMSKPQIDGIIKSFGLMPDQTRKAIDLQVTGDAEAQKKIFLTKLAADSFANGHFEAVLAALPQAAKDEITKTMHLGSEFADGNYQAILNALNDTTGGAAQALATILGVTDGKYEGTIKAVDKTAPGVNQAASSMKKVSTDQYEAMITAANGTWPGLAGASLSIGHITQQDYHALIAAHYNNANDPSVESAINWLARNRTVSVGVQYIDDPSHPAPVGAVVHTGQNGIGANGGIVQDMSNIFGGSLPLAKAFAAGGIENHVAQLSQGQTPFRIWSEPETGGEAYIPLGVNKRERSLEILKQVSEIFGFGLMKKFSDGGVVSSIQKAGYGSSSTSMHPTHTNTDSGISQSVVINTASPDSAQTIADKVSSELYWRFTHR